MRELVRIKMLLGLGVALFLAGSIHAQQSVTPSSISNASGEAQTSLTQSWAANGDYTGDTATAGANAGVLTNAEAELGRAMLTDTILLAILLSGMVLILVYTTFATRTRRELRPVLGERLGGVSYGSAAGAASR